MVDTVGIICYPTIGGSGRVASELAGELAHRGSDVHLISYERPVRLVDAVHFHQVQVFEYPLLKYPPYDQALATKIVEIHEQFGTRLFHAHYAVPHAVAVCMADWMLGGNQLRLVTTLHGTDITLVGSNPAYRRAVLFGLEHSQLVTAVSESLAADTRSRLHFEGKIEVIPNFVDPGSFAPGGGARWPERPDGPRELVHLSTFRPVKRVLDLCRAVELLAERLPLRLTLVGDGPELQEALQWCSERGLGSVVRAVGMVEDPAPYLRDSDLYVFSSETESFGLGVLEAMACAVPVVGPRVGGVPEVVGDAGCLVEPNTPEAIAAAAHKVLTDHDGYRRMSALARERALADFPPERAVERYLAAYEAAL